MTAELRFEDARSERAFRAMSAIHARGWHRTYPGYVPDDYLRDVITDDHWVPFFREITETGRGRGLLLFRGETPVACCAYGPARLPEDGSGDAYAGWGEVWSFYADPAETGRGYGGILMEEVLRRLAQDGFPACFVLVLRENEGARRFYARHGFAWDGSHVDIPFPHDMVCVDLRYTRALDAQTPPTLAGQSISGGFH